MALPAGMLWTSSSESDAMNVDAEWLAAGELFGGDDGKRAVTADPGPAATVASSTVAAAVVNAVTPAPVPAVTVVAAGPDHVDSGRRMVYDVFRQGVLDAGFDLTAAAIKVALVRDYTFDPAHGTVADAVDAGAVINGVSNALTAASITGGIFDADDTAIVTTASTAEHHLLVFQAGTAVGGADLPASGQKLIAFYDTGYGLPVQPGTGSITIAWTNKILQL